MNLFTRSVMLLSLIFFCGSSVLKAQCDLPVPANVWVNNVSATSVELEWTPVVGVNVYHVTTIDVATNTVVSVETVSGTLHTVNNLSPETEYDFEIRAVCDDGSVSNNATNPLRVSTGIIIVDIIVQITCPSGIPSAPTSYYPNFNASYSFNGFKSIVLEGHLSNGNTPFLLAFHSGINPQNRPQYTIATNFSLQSTTQIINNQNYVDIYIANQHLMRARVFSGNNSRLEVLWKAEGVFSIANCDDITFLNGSTGGRAESDDDGTSDNGFGKSKSGDIYELEIAPNPTHGLLNIDVPMDSPMDIYDSQGRLWYQGQVQFGERLQIDASNWPAGMYFVRSIENNTPKIHRFIKL